MWNLVAEFARRMALLCQHRAESLKERARGANAAAEWWHDVWAWADGADTWASLSERRRRRLRPPVSTIIERRGER